MKFEFCLNKGLAALKYKRTMKFVSSPSTRRLMQKAAADRLGASRPALPPGAARGAAAFRDPEPALADANGSDCALPQYTLLFHSSYWGRDELHRALVLQCSKTFICTCESSKLEATVY